jgi:hypothetical protein
MKITLILFLLLTTFGGWAQDVINMAPLQIHQVKPGSSVKGLMKKNHISRDTMVIIVNQRIIAGLKAKFPETEFILADSAFFKLLSDSSELRQLLTTSHLDVVNGVAGFQRTKARMKGGPTYYNGRNFTPGGVALAQDIMMKSQAKYFVLLNRFEADTDFEIHFELYDKNFTKLYGDTFKRPAYASRNMYFSTFLYYFDKFVTAFDEELVSKVKLANTIR